MWRCAVSLEDTGHSDEHSGQCRFDIHLQRDVGKKESAGRFACVKSTTRVMWLLRPDCPRKCAIHRKWLQNTCGRLEIAEQLCLHLECQRVHMARRDFVWLVCGSPNRKRGGLAGGEEPPPCSFTKKNVHNPFCWVAACRGDAGFLQPKDVSLMRNAASNFET